MSRVGLVVAAATVAVMGVGLAGCSSMPDWMPSPSMPDWFSSSSSAPQLQTLRFESDPPGADVRTIQGQTCFTPCALAVPSENQPITITKAGYMAQTIQVSVGPPPEHSFWESPPPTLVPNPVTVALQALAPPKPVRKPRPTRRSTAERTHTAAKVTPAPAQAGGPFPAPAPEQQQQPPASPFPPAPGGQ